MYVRKASHLAAGGPRRSQGEGLGLPGFLSVHWKEEGQSRRGAASCSDADGSRGESDGSFSARDHGPHPTCPLDKPIPRPAINPRRYRTAAVLSVRKVSPSTARHSTNNSQSAGGEPATPHFEFADVKHLQRYYLCSSSSLPRPLLSPERRGGRGELR